MNVRNIYWSRICTFARGHRFGGTTKQPGRDEWSHLPRSPEVIKTCHTEGKDYRTVGADRFTERYPRLVIAGRDPVTGGIPLAHSALDHRCDAGGDRVEPPGMIWVFVRSALGEVSVSPD